MIAGEDFTPGTYKVCCTPGEGSIGMLIRKFRNYYGEEELEQIMFCEGNMEFQNLTLEEGDLLLTLNCEIQMQPAEYDLSGMSVIW